MIVSGVTMANGDLLDLNRLVILLGYQIQHKVTGRNLPQTNRFEVYTMNAAFNKLSEMDYFYRDNENFNIIEYEFVPIYDFEMDSGWLQVTHDRDWEN